VSVAALAHDFGKPATTEFIDGRLRREDMKTQVYAPLKVFSTVQCAHD
jgi:hypothetical protein